MFGSWDGEEYNLQGSTQWGEDNHRMLKDGTVAYINVDCGVSGQKGAAISASPSLNKLWRSTLNGICISYKFVYIIL